MKKNHHFYFILIIGTMLFSTITHSQEIQFDFGTTIGSGTLKYRYIENAGSREIIKVKNPKANTLDFYLALITKMNDKLYLRSKLESINFKEAVNVAYLRTCVSCATGIDTTYYVGDIARYQLALDLLTEYHLLDRAKWNAYVNGGIYFAKKLPTSSGLVGRSVFKTGLVINVGANYWLTPSVGFHLSTGYRHPSFYDPLNRLEVSIQKYFLSIGISFNRKNLQS